MSDAFDLKRFLDAQASVHETALAEIRAGRKQSHWMWFVFPQVEGLGRSPVARHFAIHTLAEARAYLAHPVLGRRLRDCLDALEALSGTTAEHVFGGVDAMKLRSSLTLFAEAGGGPAFTQALEQWFGGPDRKTLDLLGERG